MGCFLFSYSTARFSKQCNKYLLILRFAAFCLAFSRSQHCVLLHLALRFVGDSSAFCMSQHCVLLQIAYFLAKSTEYFNENSVCRFSQFMAIFIQSNLRENRLFASEWHLVSKKGPHNVKFCAENFTYSQGCEVKSIPNWQLDCLSLVVYCFHCFPFVFRLLVDILLALFFWRNAQHLHKYYRACAQQNIHTKRHKPHNLGFKYHCSAIKE